MIYRRQTKRWTMLCESCVSSNFVWIYVWVNQVTDWPELRRCSNSWLARLQSSQKVRPRIIEPRHEKTCLCICEHQRRRSVCAFAQSDLHLCCSLPRSHDTSSFYIRNFKPQPSFYSWADWFVSYLVANPEDGFFGDEALLWSVINGCYHGVRDVRAMAFSRTDKEGIWG